MINASAKIVGRFHFPSINPHSFILIAPVAPLAIKLTDDLKTLNGKEKAFAPLCIAGAPIGGAR
jgi:hypothetical protein